MQYVIFIRGLSGSGKSTQARIMAQQHGMKHVEADMYFMNESNEYVFVPANIGKAHDWARNKLREYLNNGHSVVVSNTGIQVWEFDSYLAEIDMSKCHVYVLELHKTGTRIDYKCVHGLDQAGFVRQRNRWQELPQSKYEPMGQDYYRFNSQNYICEDSFLYKVIP
jgi:ABC-type dipeptide/oligopeptide/nickel transport system ATPase component